MPQASRLRELSARSDPYFVSHRFARNWLTMSAWRERVGIFAVMIESTQTTVRSLLRDLQAGNRAALSKLLPLCLTSCRR
jgi:aspartate/tyrosine/aromatic aminotransferase